MTPSSIVQQLEAFFFDRINYEREQPLKYDQRHFRLEPLKFLLEKLGNPHQSFPSIHVTGTKGKGSVSAYLGEMGRQSGLKTAIYSSPHLHSVCERYLIDGKQVSAQRLLEVVEIIRPAVAFVDRMSQADPDFGSLTFFDLCTAAAFLLFALENVELGIIEVGMGGRLDSTNVIQPKVSVITNVSLDHTAQLGNTTAKIAFEKAGIIKQNIPIVSGCTDQSACEVIKTKTDECQSRLYQMGFNFSVEPQHSSQNATLFFEKFDGAIQRSAIETKHRHQQENLSVAAQAFSLFLADTPEVDWGSLLSAAGKVCLPGRTELAEKNPPLVFDMAHNQASFSALIESIEVFEQESNLKNQRRTLVLSIAQDKPVEEVMKIAVKFFDRIIATKFTSNSRAANPSDLERIGKQLISKNPSNSTSDSGSDSNCEIQIEQDLQTAVSAARGLHQTGQTVVIAGSIFLVAESKKLSEFSKKKT